MQQHSTVEDVAREDLDGLGLVVLIWRQGDEGQTVLSRERPLGLERRWKESDAGHVQDLKKRNKDVISKCSLINSTPSTLSHIII